MLLKVLLLTYLCYTTSLTSGRRPTWNSFLQKSISSCLLPNTGTSNTIHLQSAYTHIGRCVYHIWWQCIEWQYLLISEPPRRHTYTDYWPCLKAHFVWKSQDPITFNVRSHQAFQFNLTFTYFHLKRSMYGCVYHHVTVSPRDHLM